MFIKPTSKAKGSVFDIGEFALEFLLYPANEDVPCPWDADISVKGSTVTLRGGLGPSGRGLCICECSVDEFPSYYRLEVPTSIAGDPSIMTAIEEAGWVEV